MLRTILFLLFALPIAAAPDEKAELRQDWIRSDLKRIEQFQAVLKSKELDVETLVAAFGSIDARDDVDAGFGVRRVRMHAYGGYTTIWIDLLAEKADGAKKSRVAELRARQIGPPEAWKELEPVFAKVWGDGTTSIERGFEVTRRDDALARSLRKRTADALGGEVKVDVPKELASAYALLTSPFEEVVIGSSYGYDGGVPPGRAEIEALAKAERFDLVQAVLRGINPEARLYAAWIIRRRHEVADVDARAIETLLALPAELHTTEGCSQIWRTPKEALRFIRAEK